MKQTNTIWKAILCGIAFLLLFTSYNLSYGFLTTLYGELGFYTFATIYFPYSVTSLISPWIGHKLGLRFCLLFGSLSYIVWILVLTSNNLYLTLCFSVLNGLGAGLLWVHQGIWLAKLINNDCNYENQATLDDPLFTLYDTAEDTDIESYDSESSDCNSIESSDCNSIESNDCNSIENINDNDNNDDNDMRLQRGISKALYIPTFSGRSKNLNNRKGIVNGVFLGIYNLNGILGSIITMILANYFNIFTIIWILFGIAMASWVLFWLIPYPSKNSWSLLWNKIHSTAANKIVEIDLRHHFSVLGKMIINRKLLCMIPGILQCAIYITFTYGILPLLLKLHITKDVSIIDSYSQNFLVSGLFLCYGSVAGIFSVIWGKITDKYSHRLVLYCQFILTLIQQLYIFLWIFEYISLGLWWQWWFLAVISGALDTNAVTTVNILLNTFDKEQTPYVFAWYRFIYCLGVTIFSIINVYLPLRAVPFIITIWCLISGVFLHNT